MEMNRLYLYPRTHIYVEVSVYGGGGRVSESTTTPLHVVTVIGGMVATPPRSVPTIIYMGL